MTDPGLQALLDRQAITDVINLYLRGADPHDLPDMQADFTLLRHGARALAACTRNAVQVGARVMVLSMS